MCGICGFTGETVDHIGIQNLKNMLNIMQHRGPDNEGLFYSNKAALGMRRLSIIDPENGNQPIHNEDKSIWTVFNGEIYNYRALKDSLRLKGHKFYTNTDTEVIVHLYEEYGENFVTKLSGVFAIALYDSSKDTLILVRDRLGVKPLYYSLSKNVLIFASEIKSIITNKAINKELNNSIIGSYLSYRYIPGEQTFINNVYKLMPGHYLVFSKNKLTLKQFWNMDFASSFTGGSEKYYKDNIYSLLNSAVKDRLISDVPLGILLSGGLDSSIVLALASRHSSTRLKTFSVAFERPKLRTQLSEFNELAYAKMAAKFYNAEHYEYTVSNKELIDELTDIIWFLDEPLGDPTAIPLYYVSKLAKSKVKVVLSGEGADEIFAGYRIYREPYAINRYNSLPQLLRKGLIEPMVNIMPFSFGKDFLKRSKLDISSRYKGVGRTFREEELLQLLEDEYCEYISNSAVNSYVSSIYKAAELRDDVHQMLYFDQKVWLPDDVLMKSDKISMSHSIELRVPFLDYRLVQFASNIPSSLKYKGTCEKYILKQTFKDILPEFVLKRQKNGFPVPISSLLSSEYKSFASDILLSSSSLNRGYFKRGYIERLLQNVSTKRPYICRQLWLLLTFELWNRMYIDGYNLDFNYISEKTC